MQHQPTAERMHPHVRPGAPPGHDWNQTFILDSHRPFIWSVF
jgi:hypothetical protein